MSEQNFTYELDAIDNAVEVGYEGVQEGRTVFSYDFSQPLNEVSNYSEEDPWFFLEQLHTDTSPDPEVLGKDLGDLALEYFGGHVELRR